MNDKLVEMSLLQIWKIATQTHMEKMNFDKHASEYNFILPLRQSNQKLCRHSPLIAIDKWKVLNCALANMDLCVVEQEQQRQRQQTQTNCTFATWLSVQPVKHFCMCVFMSRIETIFG